MPEVTIQIGGRGFDVSCQEGEEAFLHSAAKMLDDEAQILSDQIGRMPESRMLLMAGLMLADKVAGTDDRIKALEAKLAEVETELQAVKNMPQPEPERFEVAVVPPSVTDTLAEVAARAEALASVIEERSAG
ncbi:MAG: cell division protein ZapA [Ruegeria sp.]|nr:cell division protein ZapA [Ruegeria sp.]